MFRRIHKNDVISAEFINNPIRSSGSIIHVTFLNISVHLYEINLRYTLIRVIIPNTYRQ